jgi:hypothetical protein
MPEHEVSQIARAIEHSPTSRDGHTHNFEDAYRQIAQLQHQDGGPNSVQFKQDMASLNQKLHSEGLIPNLQIVGVDENHHTLITADRADHRVTEQTASRVNDFGALGSGHNSREFADALLARAFGINVTRNPDGSYDVADPFANPRAMEANIMNTILGGLLGVENRNPSGAPLGMNSWMWQAWNGWPEQQEK